MNICFIGKYPPIEGGVSTRNYWTAYALARRGHEVSFVTNAAEVEDRFRIALAPDDARWYEPRFEHGSVRVSSSSAPEDDLAYIPTANPFVTKLASLATQSIREQDCEIVVTSYFEPYAVAGFLASRFTGLPLVITHAGSDLGRLMKEPELATTYKEVLKGADCVLTLRRFRERFAGFGVAPERIGVDPPFALPADVFNPSATPLTAPGGSYSLAEVLHPDGRPASLEEASRRPCIGIYGKIGAAKGSFDLVAALAALRRDGVDFNLLAMTNGHDVLTARFREALVAAGLADRSYLLPFVPNWRVPAFIRSCAMVCFLERNFPVAAHGPIVAREVLACGVPLVLSREIANKQMFRDGIADGENLRLVEDPKDHAELAAVIRTVLADPVRAAEIGASGRRLAAPIEDSQRFVEQWEDVLTSVLAARTSGSLGLSSSPVATVRERLAEALPAYAEALGDAFERIASSFEDRGHTYAHGDRRIAMQFLQFVHDNRAELLAGCDPVLAETTEYLLLSLRMSGDPHDGSGTVPARESDRSVPGPLSLDAVAALRPTLRGSVVIGEFSHAAIGRASGSDIPTDGNAIVLFNRTPNLERCELRINEATRALLALCDGTRSTQEIVAQVAAGSPATALAALDRFRTLGVVAFR